MAQTIGQCIAEMENWEYSQEAYDFQKECAEFNLINQYIENQCFAIEVANRSETFTEGFLMESCNVEAIYEAESVVATKGENLIVKFFKMIGNAIKTFFSWLGKLFKGIAASAKAAVLAGLIMLGVLTAATPDDQGQLEVPPAIIETIEDKASDVSNDIGNVTVTEKEDAYVVKAEKVPAPVVVQKKIANANKLWDILNKCYIDSGLNDCGVSIKVKSDAKKSVSFDNFNASGWKTPKGQPYNLSELIFTALTDNPITFATMSGTIVMTIDDTTTIYRMILETINKEQWEFDAINKMIKDCTNKCVRQGLVVNVDEKSINKNIEIMDNINKAIPAATAAIEKRMNAAKAAIQEAVELLTEGKGDRDRNRKAVFAAQGQKEKDRILGKMKDTHQQKAEEAKQLANPAALPGIPKNMANEMSKCMGSMNKVTASVMKINSSLLNYRNAGLKSIQQFLKNNDGSIEVAEVRAS